MNLKIISAFIALMVFSSATLGTQFIVLVAESPELIEVGPGESIQAAIDAAGSGDIISVTSGIYNETLVVNKSLRLIGEDKNTTIINASGTGVVVRVDANNVYISGFTIQNGWCEIDGQMGLYDGIYLHTTHGTVIRDNIIKHNFIGIYTFHSTGNMITNNVIIDNQHGVRLYNSNENIIADNVITQNIFYAIRLQGSSSANNIRGNTIFDNIRGIYISNNVNPNNIIYHNNFISNNVQAAANNQTNAWDNGAEGNYWSNYNGTDLDGDGISETPYFVDANNIDNYPLAEPWSPIRVFDAGTWNGVTYSVTVRSNNTVASFNSSEPSKQISFNVTGPLGAEGYCNVTIPKALPWAEIGMSWLILLNDEDVTSSCDITENDVQTAIGVPVTFSTHKVVMVKIIRLQVPYSPTASFIVSVSPPIYVYTNVTFYVTTSLGGYDGDDNTTIIEYRWNFGDGTGWLNGSGYDIVKHYYDTVGHYTVTLEVYAPGVGSYVDAGYIPTYTYQYVGLDVEQEKLTFDVTIDTQTFYVTIETNSYISNFLFDETYPPIVGFDVTVLEDSVGFCNVTIPKDLLWVGLGDVWLIMLDGEDVTQVSNITESNMHTFIVIPLRSGSHRVTIRGAEVVPEFPAAFLLPILILVSLVSVLLRKKRLVKCEA